MSKAISERPNWDEYFFNICNTIAQRASCDRGKSGCVITKDNQIVTTGYVGSPPNTPHCDEVGHQFIQITHPDGRETQHCIRTVHAEQNAIAQAAKRGVSLKGTTLYCTMTPCLSCTHLIVSSGIKTVKAKRRYHNAQNSEEVFQKTGIKLEYLSSEILSY